MNWIITLAVIAVITVPLFIWWDSKSRRGTKVMILWSRFINDREIMVNPQKRYFGRNRYNKNLHVEEFKLPASMGGHIIEGLNPDEMESSNKPYPLVHLVQVGENTFIPKKREHVLLKFEMDNPDAKKKAILDEKVASPTDVRKEIYFSSSREFLSDKDVQGWGQMQIKYNNQFHEEKKKGWDKYAQVIVPAIAMIIALIIIVFAINKAGDITAESNDEIRESTGKITGLVNNFIKNQNENTNNAETDAAKPPAAQDSGGGT